MHPQALLIGHLQLVYIPSIKFDSLLDLLLLADRQPRRFGFVHLFDDHIVLLDRSFELTLDHYGFLLYLLVFAPIYHVLFVASKRCIEDLGSIV